MADGISSTARSSSYGTFPGAPKCVPPLPRPHPDPSPSQEVKDWTVLIYANGENNLDPELRKHLETLEQHGSPENVNVVVREGIANGEVTDFRITRPSERTHSGDNGPVEVEDGVVGKDMDMGQEKNLQSFLENGIKNHRARHYLVVISNHGHGHEGVSYDFVHNDHLDMHEVSKALEGAREANHGHPVDAVDFDACLMSSAEVGDELRGKANVLVGSEDCIMGEDAGRVVQDAAISSDGRSFATNLVHDGNPGLRHDVETLSAYDLNRFGGLDRAVRDFSKEVRTLDPEAVRRLRMDEYQARHAVDALFTKPTNGTDRVDLADMAQHVVDDPYLQKHDPKLVQSAIQMRRAQFAATIAERHPTPRHTPRPTGWLAALSEDGYTTPGAHGLSVWVDPSGYGSAYKPGEKSKMDFLTDTGWDGALDRIDERG